MNEVPDDHLIDEYASELKNKNQHSGAFDVEKYLGQLDDF